MGQVGHDLRGLATQCHIAFDGFAVVGFFDAAHVGGECAVDVQHGRGVAVFAPGQAGDGFAKSGHVNGVNAVEHGGLIGHGLAFGIDEEAAPTGFFVDAQGQFDQIAQFAFGQCAPGAKMGIHGQVSRQRSKSARAWSRSPRSPRHGLVGAVAARIAGKGFGCEGFGTVGIVAMEFFFGLFTQGFDKGEGRSGHGGESYRDAFAR